MADNCELIEYELIDITFELPYVLPEDSGACMVGEESFMPAANTPIIDYDEDGIPMGTSHEEVVARRQIIHEYIQKWRAEHIDNPCIFNEGLKDYVKINQLFLLESVAIFLFYKQKNKKYTFWGVVNALR